MQSRWPVNFPRDYMELEIRATKARLARKTKLADALWHDVLQHYPERDLAALNCADIAKDEVAVRFYRWLLVKNCCDSVDGGQLAPNSQPPPMPVRDSLWLGDDELSGKKSETQVQRPHVKVLRADNPKGSFWPLRRRIRYERFTE